MARYYFDVLIAGTFRRDATGVDFASDDDACGGALMALGEMARESFPHLCSGSTLTIAVRNGSGTQLFEASTRLSFARTVHAA